MRKAKKEFQIQMGRRLREIRVNCRYTQEQFAETLGVGVEHYRKLENGDYGLQPEKLLILYQIYKIDPTYLITGENKETFDLEMFLANCHHKDRDDFLEQVFRYMRKRMLK
ncbi:MAG: helix-turn-helix transcriptional regulator [Lachnospiraceae bacterium]|nr:helix-turn-helix transcriptional regulator [Lachnospiraceae bacterium]